MASPAVTGPAMTSPAVTGPEMTSPVAAGGALARPHGTAGAGRVSTAVSAVWVGQAVTEATSGDFTGRVEGVFGGGFYVSGPSGTLFAVLEPRHWPGPLHLMVEEMPVRPSLHDRVSVSDGALAAGPLSVRLDGAPRWKPSLPERLNVGPAVWRRVAGDVGPAAGNRARASSGPTARPGTAGWTDAALAPVWGTVSEDLRRGDLEAAFRRLEGRGAGATPSGDDVLAGILLVAAIDPGNRDPLTGLAVAARTTRLSRAFLRWAAVGQSIQPAHALLDAAAAGDEAGMRRAAASLAGVGATSGRALVAGIALGATELAHTDSRTMAPRPADA